MFNLKKITIGNYSFDDNNVFLKGKTLSLNELQNFNELGGYGIYNGKVTYKGNIIDNSDSKTSSIINAYYIKDKNNVYYKGKVLENIDSKTFMPIHKYEIDDLMFFSGFDIKKVEKIIKKEKDVYDFQNFDSKLFSLALFTKYYRDKNCIYNKKGNKLSNEKLENFDNFYGYNIYKGKVYFKGECINGCNSATFGRIKNNDFYYKNPEISLDFKQDFDYFMDKNYIYKEGKKIGLEELKNFDKLNGYSIYNGKVYYNGNIIEGTSAENFKIITFTMFKDYQAPEDYWWINEIFNKKNTDYAKDDKNIYYCGKKIDGINYNSFSLIKEVYDDICFHELSISNYCKDSKNIFFCGKKLDGCEVKSFQKIEYDFYRDKNNIYFLGERLKDIDLNSFQIISYNIFKDKNNVYYKGKIIKGANSKTFDFFTGYLNNCIGIDYFRDNKYTYDNSGKIITPRWFKEFDILSNEYCFYNGEIYYNGIKLDFSNSESFIELENGYSKCKNNVYYYGRNIILANPYTFEKIDDKYFKDKNNIYYEGNIVKNADVNTFEEVSGNYYRDNHNIYYNGKLIKGSDSYSFIEIGDTYYGDFENIYYKGKKIDGVKSENFKKFTGDISDYEKYNSYHKDQYYEHFYENYETDEEIYELYLYGEKIDEYVKHEEKNIEEYSYYDYDPAEFDCGDGKFDSNDYRRAGYSDSENPYIRH